MLHSRIICKVQERLNIQSMIQIAWAIQNSDILSKLQHVLAYCVEIQFGILKNLIWWGENNFITLFIFSFSSLTYIIYRGMFSVDNFFVNSNLRWKPQSA